MNIKDLSTEKLLSMKQNIEKIAHRGLLVDNSRGFAKNPIEFDRMIGIISGEVVKARLEYREIIEELKRRGI